MQHNKFCWIIETVRLEPYEKAHAMIVVEKLRTAYCVALKDGKFLMVHNGKRNGWEMPGGKIHDERGQGLPSAVAHPLGLLPAVGDEHHALLHAAGVLDGVLIPLHEILVACDAHDRDPASPHLEHLVRERWCKGRDLNPRTTND